MLYADGTFRNRKDNMENQTPVVELELYLIRHGQSEGNLERDNSKLTLKEANDPYLTEKGLHQAEKLGEALSEIDFDAVYSSALLRAVQTAAETVKRQSEEKPLYILPLLTEVSIAKEYAGAGMREITEICPSARLAFGVDESSPLVYHNEYEDEAGMFARAEEAIRYFRSLYKNGEKIAVVNHAAFMTFAVFHVMGFKAAPVFDIDFKNTAVTKVIFYKHGTNKYGDIVFEYINSTKHLTEKY